MLKSTPLACFVLAAGWLLLTSLEPNNPPTGKTGAPGETTCAQSGCHNGGSYTGTVSLGGLPDTVVANQSYTLTLTNASNAVRAGFELTCLDAANVKCGTLTAGSGVNVTSASSRQYARQSSPKNLSNGSTFWTFTWKAPVTLATDSLQFYFVSLCANNNGNKNGDNVLLNTKKVHFKSATSAASDPATGLAVRIFPNPARDFVQVQLDDTSRGELCLFDVNGRCVQCNVLEGTDNRLPVDHCLPAGTYTAQIRIGQQVVTKSLVIARD